MKIRASKEVKYVGSECHRAWLSSVQCSEYIQKYELSESGQLGAKEMETWREEFWAQGHLNLEIGNIKESGVMRIPAFSWIWISIMDRCEVIAWNSLAHPPEVKD